MSTYRSIRRPALVAGAAAIAAFGCSGERALAPPGASAPRLQSAAGFPVPEPIVRQQLARAARLVAVALAQPVVRAQVYHALRDSPHREGKLHFRPFLEHGGRPLLAGMAAAAGPGTTQRAVMALLDSVVDLELYLPVERHRARWQGGADMIVAAALRDHEIPVAFDLSGSPVRLTSAEEPPELPVLALVPVETDFGARPSYGKCYDACGGGGGGSVAPPSGVLMTFASIPGSYEGFMMGAPEFEVHAIARTSAVQTALRAVQCAGERAADAAAQPGLRSGAYVYDQNGETWTGQVLLLGADQVAAAQAHDTAVVYWIWEDDNDACRIVRDSSEVETMIRGTAGLVTGYNAIKALIQNRSLAPGSLVRAVSSLVSGFQNDDVVGMIVDQAVAGQSWTDATHAIVLKDPRTGALQLRGRVKLVPQP